MREGLTIGVSIGPDGRPGYYSAARVLPKEERGEPPHGLQEDEVKKREREKRNQQLKDLEDAFASFGYNDGGLRWQQWLPHLSEALKDQPKSITVERDDLLEPVIELATRAFASFENSDSYDQNILADLKRQRQKAQKALLILLERYPEKNFSTKTMAERSAGQIITDMKKSPVVGDLGERLGSLITSKESNVRKLIELDEVLLKTVERIYQTESSEDLADQRGELRKIVPILGALYQWRLALSQEVMGYSASPEEVRRFWESRNK